MSIEMKGNNKVELNASEVKLTADNIEMKNPNPVAPKLTEKVVLSDSVQNQFQFFTLLSNLQAYVAKAIEELDPNVTNQTIDFVANDIKSTSGLVDFMNFDAVHTSDELSTVFFGKRSAPTLSLSDDFDQDKDDNNSVPFGHYMELREERMPTGGAMARMSRVPMLFNVVATGNGYHLVTFIGFEAAFQRVAEIFSQPGNFYSPAPLDRMQTQPLQGAFGQYPAHSGQVAGGLYPQRFAAGAASSGKF